MSLVEWLTLAGICFGGAASPGPSLAVVLNASVNGGRLQGVCTAWAHAGGVALYALLTVIGASAILANTPSLFTAVQILGIVYLLFLSQRLLRTGRHAADDDDQSLGSRRSASPLDGFAIAFLNPKLALFMLALFSQFVSPSYGAHELALLVTTAGVIDGMWYTLVALLLTQPRWLAVLKAKAAIIDRVFGVMLALLAAVIIIEVLA